MDESEERALVERMRQGDESARKRLLELNQRLVLNLARVHRQEAAPTSVPLGELVLAGEEGLSQALDRFDPRRGFRLSTYATHWIRQAIGRRLDCEGRPRSESAEGLRLPARRENASGGRDEETVLALVRAVKGGDDGASARLLELYGDLVERIARDVHRRFWKRKPLEDLRLAGKAGLLQAAQGFDPEKGFRFSTYATHWIRQAVVARLPKA